MATEFKILRGKKSTLITEDGTVLIPSDKLINGYWYLTNDTAEVFVCLPDELGNLTLRKINECNADIDFPDMESFEDRISALEADHTITTYGYRKLFPVVGEVNHIYVAEDEGRTYVYSGGRYVHIADQFMDEDTDGDNIPDVRIIHGGSANKTIV